MPPRSNEYQKLVLMINRALASENTNISESAMLYDSEANCEREVDILIKSTVSGHEISIGIECTCTTKPVEIRILESFKEKHRKIGINKTIVVSKNGFTKTSKEYAKKNHIRLLTFNMADREKWSTIFEPYKKVSIYGRSYKIISISFAMDKKILNPEFDINNEIRVIWKEKIINIVEFCTELWRDCGVNKAQAKSLRENELTGQGEPWIEIGFDLNRKTIFLDKEGLTGLPESINFKMNYTSNYQDLDSKEVEYDDKNYVIGAFKKNKQFAHFAMHEKDGVISVNLEASANLIPDVYSPLKTTDNQKKL